ncbi:MAG: DUF6600 domain-containing protein [Terriglobia bacterium]
MRLKLLSLIIAGLAFVSFTNYAQDQTDIRILRPSLIEGDVTYQRPDLDRWVDLSVNTPLMEGDKVWAGNDGRVEIEFEDGTFLRLDSNSIVEFPHLGTRQGPDPLEMNLVRGVASFEIQPSGVVFVMDTPLFSTRVKDKASFRLDLEENGTGRLSVFEGDVEVAGDKAHLFVRKGEVIRFNSEDPERYYLSADYLPDQWDRWNEDRSAYLSRRVQDRYHDGDESWNTADLDSAGNWYNDSEYGRVWSPNLGVDWAPYRNGRWIWCGGGLGWTWISDESWGWIPYHYGRWTHHSDYGWCWVPSPKRTPWCPGAVNWIEGPNWIGWVPLAPFEPWSPYSSSSIFVSKNYGVRQGRTCISRDAFLRGTPANGFVQSDYSYTGARVISGQPRFTPAPASRMPVATSTLPTRVYNNQDLDARRIMRERALNPQRMAAPPPDAPQSANSASGSVSRSAGSSLQGPTRQPSSSAVTPDGGTMVVQTSNNGVRTYILKGNTNDVADRGEQLRQTTSGNQATTQPSGSATATPGNLNRSGSRFAQTNSDSPTRGRSSGSSTAPPATDRNVQVIGGRSESPSQNRFPVQSPSQTPARSTPSYNFYDPPPASSSTGSQVPVYGGRRVDATSPTRSLPATVPSVSPLSPISSGGTVSRSPASPAVGPPTYQPPSTQPASSGSVTRGTSSSTGTSSGNGESRGSSGTRSGR